MIEGDPLVAGPLRDEVIAALRIRKGLPSHLPPLNRSNPTPFFSSSLLLSSLELNDAKVYEPQIRALLGTSSHFCEEVVLKMRTVPIGTAPAVERIRRD